MVNAEPKRSPITLYLSYAQQDGAFKQEFEKYLAIWQQIGYISGWAERLVEPSSDWSQVIDPRLQTADLVVLLVSPNLLGSGYCSGAEMREALSRHKAGNVILIPILLCPVDLTGFSIWTFQTLPARKPVTAWPDRDQAWGNVDQNIREVIEFIRSRP